MAQRSFAFNLRKQTFPLLSSLQGQTTLADSYGEQKISSDRPGIAYCHNVLPTSDGFTSIGYDELFPASDLVATRGTRIQDVRRVYSTNRNRLIFAWDNLGYLYCIKDGDTEWQEVSVTRLDEPVGDLQFAQNTITIGDVRGVSYIYHANAGCFTFDEDTNTIIEVELVGLEIADVIGVVGSFDYLVAYTTTSVAWSSTITVTDFEPSDITGSGGGDVSNLAGEILFCVPYSYGFLIYTDANIISAAYTSNAFYPFKFTEVTGSKGGLSLNLVAYEANIANQIAYTKGGIQAIAEATASNELVEITDFLSGRRFEDYDEDTDTFSVEDITSNSYLNKQIKLIASRYIVISYGINGYEFTHAIVVDMTLNKWGKLKFTHTDVIEYIGDSTEVATETLCLVAADGTISYVNTTVTREGSGVLMLGKVRYSLTHLLQLATVELSNVESDDTISLLDKYSFDGKNLQTKTAYELSSSGEYRMYGFNLTAATHNMMVTGKFNLVDISIKFALRGRR